MQFSGPISALSISDIHFLPPRPLSPLAIALQTLLGEFAEATLLSSCAAKPAVLLETGFVFQHPDLKSALLHQLGRA